MEVATHKLSGYLHQIHTGIYTKKNPNLLNWVIHSLKNTTDLLIVHIGVLKWNSTAIVIFQKYILSSLYFKSAQYGH